MAQQSKNLLLEAQLVSLLSQHLCTPSRRQGEAFENLPSFHFHSLVAFCLPLSPRSLLLVLEGMLHLGGNSLMTVTTLSVWFTGCGRRNPGFHAYANQAHYQLSCIPSPGELLKLCYYTTGYLDSVWNWIQASQLFKRSSLVPTSS